jgi:hypothetical protein
MEEREKNPNPKTEGEHSEEKGKKWRRKKKITTPRQRESTAKRRGKKMEEKGKNNYPETEGENGEKCEEREKIRENERERKKKRIIYPVKI